MRSGPCSGLALGSLYTLVRRATDAPGRSRPVAVRGARKKKSGEKIGLAELGRTETETRAHRALRVLGLSALQSAKRATLALLPSPETPRSASHIFESPEPQ